MYRFRLFLFMIAVVATNISANRTYEFLIADGALALVHPLYGTETITEPVLIDLIQSHELQRLKKINQYGSDEFLKSLHYTRFDHSIGVLMLLRAYNAALPEQIAGLLHDVSHTVFSHTGDWLFQATNETDFNPGSKDSFQDDMHHWYLSNSSLKGILERYDFTIESIEHKNGNFLMFEQSLPDLCIDRIEYNLYGGYIENYVSKDEVQMILSHLFFDGANWYFDDARAARSLANVSMAISEFGYNSDDSNIIAFLTAKLLKIAQGKAIISLDDIFYSTDECIWFVLENSVDPEIQDCLGRIQHRSDYQLCDADSYEMEFSSKFRCVDPFVLADGSLIRLTQLDPEFASVREAYRSRITAPKYFKFVG
jgi:uncharacterized protein